MRYLLGGLAAVSLLVIAPADAGKRSWYASVEAGQSDSGVAATYVGYDPFFAIPYEIPLGKLDESLTFLGTLGGHVSEDFRIEAEIGLRNGDLFNGDASQATLMLNAAYDIPILDCLSISLGIGAGLDWVSVDSGARSEDGIMLAFQGIAGLSYELTNDVDIVLNYRYLKAMGPEFGESPPPFGGIIVEDADDETISLGLRFAL